MNDKSGNVPQSPASSELYSRLLTWLTARRPGLVPERRPGAELALRHATGHGLPAAAARTMLTGTDPAAGAQERSVLRLLVPPGQIRDGVAAFDVSGLGEPDPAEHLDELLRGFGEAYDAIGQDGEAFAKELAAADPALADVPVLDPDDRRRQEWMIEAAAATRAGAVRHWCLATGTAVAAGPPDPQRALDHAVAVARELSALAYRDGRRVNWLGLEPLEDGHWTVLPAGLGLSHGYTGVALFLAQLAALTGRSEFHELAADALIPAPDLVAALAERPAHLAAIGGGFTGMGGVAYALRRLSVLLDSAELRATADLAAGLAARAVAGDPPPAAYPDLFNDSWCHGLASRAAAGALDAADLTIWLARLAAAPPLSDLTVCHGEFGILEALTLLAPANPQARATLDRRAARLPDPVAGGAAFSGTPGAVPTPGFLHGLAGVGYGLLRIAFPDVVPSVLTLDPGH